MFRRLTMQPFLFISDQGLTDVRIDQYMGSWGSNHPKEGPHASNKISYPLASIIPAKQKTVPSRNVLKAGAGSKV